MVYGSPITPGTGPVHLSVHVPAHVPAHLSAHVKKVGSGRTECRQTLAMSMQPDRRTHDAIRRAQNGIDRSPFYEWLFELHDDLVAHGGRLVWKSICERAAELGKHDGVGKPPTPRRAAKTWLAVRTAKAVEVGRLKTEPVSLARDSPQQDHARPPATHASRSEPQPVEPAKRIAPTDPRPDPGTWLGRSLKGRPDPADPIKKAAPAYPNAIPVASISRTLMPEPEQDRAGEQTELSPGQESMKQAIREMHERANRRTGYIKGT